MPQRLFFSTYWDPGTEKLSDLEFGSEDPVLETGMAKILHDALVAGSAAGGVSFPPYWQPLPKIDLEFGFWDPVVEIGPVNIPETGTAKILDDAQAARSAAMSDPDVEIGTVNIPKASLKNICQGQDGGTKKTSGVTKTPRKEFSKEYLDYQRHINRKSRKSSRGERRERRGRGRKSRRGKRRERRGRRRRTGSKDVTDLEDLFQRIAEISLDDVPGLAEEVQEVVEKKNIGLREGGPTQQQRGLRGGAPTQQTKSYAHALKTGLQGGAKDKKASHVNSANSKTDPFLRLENRGGVNACFVNSVLQLIKILDLIKQLEQDPERPLCSALAQLYSEQHKEVLSAQRIRSLVAKLSGKGHFDQQLPNGTKTQEDAAEFLESLFLALSDELKTSLNAGIEDPWGEICYQRTFKNQPRGECPSCHLKPNPRNEPFLLLRTPVPVSGSNHTLGSVVANVFSQNDEGTDDLKCSHCCKHDRIPGLKCTCDKHPCREEKTLSKSPKSLLIHLLRYSEGSKIKTQIQMEEEFHLNGTKYQLQGLICHKGHSVHHGHYVSYLKHSGSWFLHNDDQPAEPVQLRDIDKGEEYIILAKRSEEVAPRATKMPMTPSSKRRAVSPTPDQPDPKQTLVSENDMSLRVAELKKKSTKRTVEETEELIDLLATRHGQLKAKGKQKSEQEIKEFKSLKEQLSRFKRGQAHHAADQKRKAAERLAMTPEKRKDHFEAERVRDRARKPAERLAVTPEKREGHLEAERVRDRARWAAMTPEKRTERVEAVRRRRSEKTQIKAFREETKFGPNFVCICCHRRSFKTSLQIVDEKLNEMLLSKKKNLLPAERVVTHINGSKEYICKTCLSHIKRNNLPPMAVENNLWLDPIPDDQKLTIIEGCLIAKLIIFQIIRLTPKSRWRRLQDRLISVPIMDDDVLNTVRQLPRTPEEAGLVAVTFKRKMEYKTSHISEQLVNPQRIYKVLELLVKRGNPYYKEFQDYEDFRKRCIREDKDKLSLIFPNDEDVQDILNLSDMSIEDNVQPNMSDMSIDDPDDPVEANLTDGEEDGEEEYMRKDPVKKYQLDGHNRSSCLSNKFPEETHHDDTKSVQVAPGEGKIPINLLNHKDWDIQAFPHLHNYDGQNGLHMKRETKLSHQDYFQQRINNKDNRFRENHMYLYSAVGAIERQQIQRNINLSYSRGKVQEEGGSTMTLKLDDPYICLENIKNTPRYWQQEKYVMNAKLENLGAFNVFFTLSCADGRWPEVVGGILSEKGYHIEVRSEVCEDGFEVNKVYVISNESSVPLEEFLENELPESRHELLRGSVLSATRYFNERVRKFISKVVMDKKSSLPVKYYTYKVEFQQRGAPHIHGVLWLDLDKLEQMNGDLKITDDPGDSKPFPSLKSAFQKLKSDEELNEEDLMSLENLVETFSSVCIDPREVGEYTSRIVQEVNTHSHTVTCKKGDRVECRFRFPRFPSAKTIIQRPWRLFKGDEDKKKRLKEVLESVKTVLQDETAVRAITETFKEELDYNTRIKLSIEKLLNFAEVSEDDYYEALSWKNGYGVIHKRGMDELFVNPYNLQWIRAWDANCDFQFAFDFHSVITYITDYYSKSEPGLTEALKKALKESSSSQARERMITAANVYQTHRQIGESEAAYKLMPSLHLRDSNVTCQWVPTGRRSDKWKRMMRVEHDEKKGLPEGMFKIEGREGVWKQQQDITEKYYQRPESLEKMCLMQFCKMYVAKKRSEKQESDDEESHSSESSSDENSKKFAVFSEGNDKTGFCSEYVVHANRQGEDTHGTLLPEWIELKSGATMKKRSFPQVARYHKARGDKKDQYYLQQLQLYKHHREEDIQDWEETPGVFYLEEEKGIRRVSSIVMEHLESVEEARVMTEQLETRADLTEIGLDMDPTGEQDDEEARDEGDHQDKEMEVLNPNQYNISKEVEKGGSIFRKVELPAKAEMHKKMQRLDKNQQRVVEICIRNARDIVKAEKGNRPPEPILLVVSGGAGSGKSTVIESVEEWVNYILSGLECGESGHTTDQPLLVKCAFTGAAADNIGGNTLTRCY